MPIKTEAKQMCVCSLEKYVISIGMNDMIILIVKFLILHSRHTHTHNELENVWFDDCV